ncbi:MAG: glycosyltransferase [Mariprofundales bacterium]
MYKNKSIAVVVPCYNEEKLIERVITTLPEYIDKVYVIDDKSQDKTITIVESLIAKHQSKMSILLISHAVNQGVGAAIASGYKATVFV